MEGWTTSPWPWGVAQCWCFLLFIIIPPVLPGPHTTHCADPSSTTHKMLLQAFSDAPNTGITGSHDALATVKVLNLIYYFLYDLLCCHWKLPLRVHSRGWASTRAPSTAKLMPGFVCCRGGGRQSAESTELPLYVAEQLVGCALACNGYLAY